MELGKCIWLMVIGGGTISKLKDGLDSMWYYAEISGHKYNGINWVRDAIPMSKKVGENFSNFAQIVDLKSFAAETKEEKIKSKVF